MPHSTRRPRRESDYSTRVNISRRMRHLKMPGMPSRERSAICIGEFCRSLSCICTSRALTMMARSRFMLGVKSGLRIGQIIVEGFRWKNYARTLQLRWPRCRDLAGKTFINLIDRCLSRSHGAISESISATVVGTRCTRRTAK